MCTIEAGVGLGDRGRARAAELGPAEVLASGPARHLLRQAGFVIEHEENVTTAFATVCDSVLRAREGAESELREAEGDLEYETEQDKKARMLHGIGEGLLVRTLVVARKPPL